MFIGRITYTGSFAPGRKECNLNKYHNLKTTIDGIKFDSKREAERYAELKLMEKAKLISNLKLQPKFLLQGTFRYKDKTEKSITYIADFMYIDSSGNTVVEDVKGVETKEFKVKRKMFLYHYGDRYDYRLVR